MRREVIFCKHRTKDTVSTRYKPLSHGCRQDPAMPCLVWCSCLAPKLSVYLNTGSDGHGTNSLPEIFLLQIVRPTLCRGTLDSFDCQLSHCEGVVGPDSFAVVLSILSLRWWPWRVYTSPLRSRRSRAGYETWSTCFTIWRRAEGAGKTSLLPDMCAPAGAAQSGQKL